VKPELDILFKELYAACDKALCSGNVHPVEVLGALSMQVHAFHRQCTDRMLKPFEQPANVQPMPAPAADSN
jgi:hypothetical protein